MYWDGSSMIISQKENQSVTAHCNVGRERYTMMACEIVRGLMLLTCCAQEDEHHVFSEEDLQ